MLGARPGLQPLKMAEHPFTMHDLAGRQPPAVGTVEAGRVGLEILVFRLLFQRQAERKADHHDSNSKVQS